MGNLDKIPTHSFDEAKDEANKMEEKIETGEAADYSEAEKIVDAEKKSLLFEGRWDDERADQLWKIGNLTQKIHFNKLLIVAIAKFADKNLQGIEKDQVSWILDDLFDALAECQDCSKIDVKHPEKTVKSMEQIWQKVLNARTELDKYLELKPEDLIGYYESKEINDGLRKRFSDKKYITKLIAEYKESGDDENAEHYKALLAKL